MGLLIVQMCVCVLCCEYACLTYAISILWISSFSEVFLFTFYALVNRGLAPVLCAAFGTGRGGGRRVTGCCIPILILMAVWLSQLTPRRLPALCEASRAICPAVLHSYLLVSLGKAVWKPSQCGSDREPLLPSSWYFHGTRTVSQLQPCFTHRWGLTFNLVGDVGTVPSVSCLGFLSAGGIRDQMRPCESSPQLLT